LACSTKAELFLTLLDTVDENEGMAWSRVGLREKTFKTQKKKWMSS